MIPANTPDLAGHISELEEMHKFAEGELVKLSRPMVFFYRIDELKIPELDDADTKPSEKHQYNGDTPTVSTQSSPPHSPPEDASVAFSAPPPLPQVEAGDAALQEREGDLPDVRLLGDNYMPYSVYQDWVHQNSGDHLDRGISEYSKWQVQWKNLSVYQPNTTTYHTENLG